MGASKLFDKKFKRKYLGKLYHDKISLKTTPGIDRINRVTFERDINQHLELIERKVKSGTYKFTKYREKLISKGRDKTPRLISIPTIRDKITIKVLSEILVDTFPEIPKLPLVHTVISDLKNVLLQRSFDSFIRVDIRNFYPSIDHDILLKKIKRKIRKKEIIQLIDNALKTPTVPVQGGYDKKISKVEGVPQGLSISNFLANVYLSDIDILFRGQQDLAYFRFVDDILIVCNKKDVNKIKNKTNEHFERIKLSVNTEKSNTDRIRNGFSFLGYEYKNFDHYPNTMGFSVRKESIRKLEDSLIKIFTEYKYSSYKNTSAFIWKLNLKITGCIKDAKKFGWLFFFSQIDHLKLLYYLDWFVDNLMDRFKVNKTIHRKNIKRFVRVYHEIIFNLNGTKYIPNFDNFSEEQWKETLSQVFNVNIKGMDKTQLERNFNHFVYRSIKDLEKDIQNFS